MSVFNKFYCLVADLANGVHKLGTDQLYIMLTDTLPDVGLTSALTIPQIAAGNGYTVGGLHVLIATSNQINGVYKLVPSGTPTFTASGGPIAQFRYAVFYNSSTTNYNPIGWWDFGSEVILQAGNSLAINFDPSLGIFQLS